MLGSLLWFCFGPSLKGYSKKNTFCNLIFQVFIFHIQ